MSFHKDMQRFEANVAIGANTVRGKGNGGVAVKMRAMLADIPLGDFVIGDPTLFRKQLDYYTERLRREMPQQAQSWGLSRKCLNIFLRQCYYNRFLSDKYDLHQPRELFEVPLDSHVANGLRDADDTLPKWISIKKLDVATSDQYQRSALALSRKSHGLRVHLDLTLWRPVP